MMNLASTALSIFDINEGYVLSVQNELRTSLAGTDQNRLSAPGAVVAELLITAAAPASQGWLPNNAAPPPSYLEMPSILDLRQIDGQCQLALWRRSNDRLLWHQMFSTRSEAEEAAALHFDVNAAQWKLPGELLKLDSIPSGQASASPCFAARIEVSQMESGTPGITGMLLSGSIPMLLCAVPAVWLMEHADEQTGFMFFLCLVGFLASVILSMVGGLAGFVLWFAISEWWERRRGVSNFYGTTQVIIDDVGVRIENLGRVGWADVLALEGVPDSDTRLIVHTQGLCKLMFTLHAVDDVVPIFQYHMARHTALQQESLREPSSCDCNFRALVFHWPRFMAWIVLGYMLGIATWLAMIVAGEREFFSTLLMASGLAVVVAWLVWAIPISQISTFSPSRMRSFELQGDQLRRTDGCWEINLTQSRISRCQSTGFGYQLDFISLRPKHGRRLDLLLGADDMGKLTERWSLNRPAAEAND